MEKIYHYLNQLYASEQAASAYERLTNLLTDARQRISSTENLHRYSEKDVILITYGDSLRQPGEAPLRTLHRFATDHLQEIVSAIHILPFYPYSSDDGFSVVDYYRVNPDLGNWTDVERLGEDFALMFDAVFNHMSAQSAWFQRFLANDPDYGGMFLTESPDTDLSMVTRPRALPLLTPFAKPNGETIHVWTTFSADQVDFDVRQPDTLLRLIEVLLFYVEKGASFIRLDAIAYLWKEVGTTCIHLPQTHVVIQLMRAVLDEVAPQAILITETNVPHQENISYFGNGSDEAQMVYNFALPPLLMYTLLHGTPQKFAEWVNSLHTPSDQTTFFNFTASHDGIGVRPVEGLLTSNEIQALIQKVHSTGGRVSFRQNSDGSQSPYELNVAYVDAIIDPQAPLAMQVRQFLLSQGIQLALAGIPAIYIHSLLGSRNALDWMQRAGHNRAINRAAFDLAEIESTLQQEQAFRAQVFKGYLQLIKIRRAQAAFHPNAPQIALDMGTDGVLGLLRGSEASGQVLTLFNISDRTQSVTLTDDLAGSDLLSGRKAAGIITLEPYQQAWLLLNHAYSTG